MAAAEGQLDDVQAKALEEEIELLKREQKLLNIDIKAMELEMKRRSGQPAPMDRSALTSLQQLASLSAELTQLQLEEMTFHLMSAENGVSITRWRVRVVSPEADVEICLKYDARKDEESNVTCSGLAIEDFTPSLGTLTDAAADDPRVVLFGVYQLGQLVAERRRVLGSRCPAEHSEPARVPLRGGKHLHWSIEMMQDEARFRRVLMVEDRKGALSPLPAALQELLQDHGVQALIDFVQSSQR